MLLEITLGAIGSVVARTLLGDIGGTLASEIAGQALREALQKQRPGNQARRQSEAWQAPRLVPCSTIISRTRGRLRLALETSLGSVPGIVRTTANPGTGTVLVVHQPALISAEHVIDLVEQARARHMSPSGQSRGRLAPVA